MPFLDSLEEEHRRWIQYGIMLLKVLSDFKVVYCHRKVNSFATEK